MEDLQVSKEGTEEVKNVTLALREGGSKMTLNEITQMRERI